MKKKNAGFIISTSFGECEFVFPIILENLQYFNKINILILDKNIYNKLQKDSLFKEICKISACNIYTSNYKFLKLIYLIKICILSKLIFHSEDMYVLQNILTSFFIKLFLCKGFLFKHTSSPWFVRNIKTSTRNYNRDKNKKFLLYNSGDIKIFSKMGFRNIVQINNFNNSYEVEKLLKKKFYNKLPKKYILILSYRSHPILHKNKRLITYKNLFDIIFDVYPNHSIIIKPHPSEKISEINEIKMRYPQRKIIISQENTDLLIQYSITTIGILTSGPYKAHFKRKKCAIYYENMNDYLRYHEENYKSFEAKHGGIRILRNKNELKKFFYEKIINYLSNSNKIDIKNIINK